MTQKIIKNKYVDRPIRIRGSKKKGQFISLKGKKININKSNLINYVVNNITHQIPSVQVVNSKSQRKALERMLLIDISKVIVPHDLEYARQKAKLEHAEFALAQAKLLNPPPPQVINSQGEPSSIDPSERCFISSSLRAFLSTISASIV